jgi:hypothetical protein
MTKIKNFRITLRPREVARILKTQEKMQLTPALEQSIEVAINDNKRQLQPAAIYTTLTRSTAEKTTSLPLADPCVAVSIVAVSLAPGVENEIATAGEGQDPLQTALLRALREEALQQSVQFIVRLLESQAKEEECDMTPPRDASDEVLLRSLGPLLGLQRIGIDLNMDKPELPPYARLVWTVWTPKVRVKTPARSAGRSEKAAV